jgi:predicted DCC family thiol-disulfide oxidoreductase YuxK
MGAENLGAQVRPHVVTEVSRKGVRQAASTPANARATVIYDDQCEFCQASIDWLRALDRRGSIDCVGIDRERVEACGLDVKECERQLHVIKPSGKAVAGWDAVAWLARRFPATWAIGALGAVPPFSWVARRAYRWFARHRHAFGKCGGGVCGQ